uniref:Putative dTDP-4-dehydrorhamnose reductase n=1 Tax=viral metagenome TaxID=1070528 RepID=A0A6M3J824_9ZZZZ
MKLIIGNGEIGSALYAHLRKFGETQYTSRNGVGVHLDLGEKWILPPCETAYICSGKTKTKECEDDPEGTRFINVIQTVKLANELVERGTRVIFISSERVFNGLVPFRKVNDPYSPTTEYGRQKVEAELALRGVTVIRFGKVLGWDVPLFEGWIEDLLDGRPIYPFSDVGMAPVSLEFAVEMLRRVEGLAGTHQISGDRDLSYDRIAFYIANNMGADLSLVRPVKSVPHPFTTLESDLPDLIGVNVPDSWNTIEEWCHNRVLDRAR